MVSNQENTIILLTLFGVREDVFSVRWENGNKLDYMPTVFYAPYRLWQTNTQTKNCKRVTTLMTRIKNFFYSLNYNRAG